MIIERVEVVENCVLYILNSTKHSRSSPRYPTHIQKERIQLEEITSTYYIIKQN